MKILEESFDYRDVFYCKSNEIRKNIIILSYEHFTDFPEELMNKVMNLVGGKKASKFMDAGTRFLSIKQLKLPEMIVKTEEIRAKTEKLKQKFKEYFTE